MGYQTLKQRCGFEEDRRSRTLPAKKIITEDYVSATREKDMLLDFLSQAQIHFLKYIKLNLKIKNRAFQGKSICEPQGNIQLSSLIYAGEYYLNRN